MDFDDMEMSSPAPGVVMITHAAHLCEGEYCCVHNPSDHHMKTWPTTFRSDRVTRINGKVFVLTERICAHGIGHPDPDSIAYARRISGDGFTGAEGVHGCDWCCAPPPEDSP